MLKHVLSIKSKCFLFSNKVSWAVVYQMVSILQVLTELWRILHWNCIFEQSLELTASASMQHGLANNEVQIIVIWSICNECYTCCHFQSLLSLIYHHNDTTDLSIQRFEMKQEKNNFIQHRHTVNFNKFINIFHFYLIFSHKRGNQYTWKKP